MIRRLLLPLVAALGCSSAKPVAYTYQTTKEEAVRQNVRTPVHLVDVPAYWLVAEDRSECEVDSVVYLHAQPRTRVVCQWVRP